MLKKVGALLLAGFFLNGCATLQDYDRRFKEAMQNSFSNVKSMFGSYQTYEIHDPANKELPLLVAGKYGVSSLSFDLEAYDLATKAFVFDSVVEEVIHEKKKPLEVEVFEASFSQNNCSSEKMFKIIKSYDSNNDRVIEMDEVGEFLETRIHRELKTKNDLHEVTNKIFNEARDKYKIWILAQATHVSLYASGASGVKQMDRNSEVITVEVHREKLFLELKQNEQSFLYVHDLRENKIVGYEGVNIKAAINNPEILVNAQKYLYSDNDNKNEYLEALVNMRDCQAELVKSRTLKN